MDCKSKVNTTNFVDSCDILDDIDEIFCISVDVIDYSFCVLCGINENNHYAMHKFIRSKEHHRCIKCEKFFFEHSHINSCYEPLQPVRIDEH